MATLNKFGLLQSEDPLQSAQSDPNSAGPNDAPLQSPLAQAGTPTLAGGATGVQRMDYGGALANANKQYAFNPKYAAYDQGLQRAIANAAFDRTNTYNALNAGFSNATKEAERQNLLAQKALQARLSSQGIGNSGIMLDASGELTGDYNRYVGSLTSQYQGGINQAENQYGRTLGDIAAQREQLWTKQGEEEEARRREEARLAAEAEARRQQAEAQRQWQQQMLAQQRAAAAQQPPGGYNAPRANAIGADMASIVGGLFTGVNPNTTYDQLLAAMNGITDLDWLTEFYGRLSNYGAPSQFLAPVRKAIVQANTPGGQYYIPQPVGHNDRPYGFDQGGIAL